MRKCLLILAAAAVSGCSVDHCEDPGTMPAIMAEDIVLQTLRSPSTAEFGSTLRVATITRTGECSFSVRNFVDAQNGFGATVRQWFTVEMIHDPADGTWRGQNLRLEQ